eukprot:gb/GFBE01007451.1/.p1 GENE.gb/GFBE01007451.1/~~gb/GFBE01007451.1/.p1  ORF type:complete len:338 (+),score=74.01 gb/GFBE01007451.1/:1-1014(+)
MAGPQVAGPMDTDPLLAARIGMMGRPMVGGAAFVQRGPRQALLNLVLAPWMTFTLAGFLFLYCYHHLPVLVTMILSLWVGLCLTGYAYVQQRKKDMIYTEALRMSYMLMLCVAAAGVGALAGYWNYTRVSGVQDYWLVGEHRQYTNVWPDELADAHRDASVLVFAKGSKPDMRMAASFASGTTGEKYCVAPVVPKQQDFTNPLTLQYFLAGKDCCTKDEFTCGDAALGDAHAGIVYQEKTNALHSLLFGRQDLDYFKEAAQMVSAKFSVKNAEQPIFLTWVADTAVAHDGFWTQAKRMWMYSSAGMLPLCLVAALGAQAVVAMELEKKGNRKADAAV